VSALTVKEHPGGVAFSVWVKPRSSRSVVLGVRGDALEVAVTAPPVEGAANEEVIAVLARFLGVSKRAVTIMSGQTGRTKRVAVIGVTPQSLLALLSQSTSAES
jgi:uncharacterized protein (TIGR00251 family)